MWLTYSTHYAEETIDKTIRKKVLKYSILFTIFFEVTSPSLILLHLFYQNEKNYHLFSPTMKSSVIVLTNFNLDLCFL